MPGLSAYPVSFSLENGRINVIKFHEEDPLHFVNIKRGVLSAFVFKMSQTQREVRENHTDVHGTCPMSSRPGDKPSTVVTSKDMLHCHLPSRPDWQFSPWSLFWNMSFIQHVINSTTDCTYGVDSERRRLEEVTCKERHAIMLESTHRTTTAVQTNVNYHLIFVSEEQTSNPWSGRALVRKSGIQYEYEDTAEPRASPPRFLAKAQKMLSDLVLDSLEEIRLSTIPQFTDLVAWFRSSHDLRPFVDSVSACAFLPQGVSCDEKVKDLAISFLSDALLQCNSLPCVKALTHLATQGDLSPEYLDVVYQSWSYMHHAEPFFIENFRVLCESTKSHQCWLSLGSYVQRIYNRATDVSLRPYKNMVGKEAKEVAIAFGARIGADCDASEEDSKTLPDCLIFLKAAGNMGRYYGQVLRPEATYDLVDLATNENALVVVRVSALETLKDVSHPDNPDKRGQIYDRLLPLLQNVSAAASVRILAYEQLVAVSEDHYFEEHLLRLLKDEKNVEVRHYVAGHLNSLMADKEFREKRWKFFYTLNDLLRENSLSLEKILHESKGGRSTSSSNSALLNLPFLPDSVRRFGLKIRDTFLYDSPIHPSVVSHETVLQLFSVLLPTTKIGGYFEGFEELLLAYKKNLQEMDSKPPTASKMYEALTRTLAEFGQDILKEGSLRNFDEEVLSNLKKLHQLYWQHHSKPNPFARAYFDLFGSTIKYFALDSLHSGSVNQGLGAMMKSVTQKLSEGATYSRTRVIRLIEAYHQVPTMMGLPLNWTTNATLAFSVRAGLKYDASGKKFQVQTNGFLEPSAALTFLNRMVLDFPTVTQIGVQANSSGYTSTQLKAQFGYSEGKQSLRFERPSKTQKVLELFRTNQMIKHDRYEDIEDWDIERVSSSWCSREDAGLKFCLSKSYPNVTHRLKPWALMAGWCKWQFLLHPTSQNSVHYDLELQQDTKEGIKKKQYGAKVSVTEGDVEKASRFRATLDENGKTKTMELKTSLSPDFSFFVTKSDLTAGKKVSGYKVEANLQLLKDFAYQLEMSNENKVLKSPSKSGLPPVEDSLTNIHEQKVSLTTPYSAYLWNKTSMKLGENVKVEAYASYENLGGENTWLKNTFPPSFWEDDKRAFAKVRLHWKKPVHGNERTTTRQTEFLLQIPRYVMTLNANGFESRHKQQSTFNLARTDVNRGKLDAFMNLTLDWWTTDDEMQHRKHVATANLTIPRRSWEASFQQIGGNSRFQHEITLRRALMKTKNDVKSDYVGWWNEAVGDRFRVEEQEIKLTADNSWAKTSAEALVEKYSTVTAEDLEGLHRHHDVSNHIAFTYPSMGRTESLVYDGYIILSGARYSTRYQKNFDLTSSYHNLKLTSHSVYRRQSEEGTAIDHSSHFTQLGTGTKAYNTIHYTSKERGRCYPATFHHEIRSHVLDLTTDADWTCRQEEEEGRPLYTLRLTLDTNSSMWNMLDMKLEQIVEDVSSDYSREEMTTTHAAGTIHVDAEWHKNPKHHEKRVVLCSKDGNCPNAELQLEDFDDDDRKTVKFSLPNREDTQITYERKVSSNDKLLDVKVTHYNQQDGLSDMLDFTGEILDRHFHVWRGALNASSYAKVRDLVTSGYAAASGAFARAAMDEEHPLNKILRPALKMSLYDYWNGLKKRVKGFFATSWSELFEVIYAAESFTEPVNAIFVNTVNNAEKWCGDAYKYLKEKTVTVWAIDYFHLPYYFQEGASKLPHTLKDLAHQLSLGEENVLYFKYVTGNLLSLGSFTEFPSIDFFPLLQKMALFQPEDKPAPPYARWAQREKVAAIFGVHHVYTFDGRLYDVPLYPPDRKDGPSGGCTYLLAHDVRRSLFTALSTRNSLHLLFPEMTVTIDDYNRVYINGSRRSSELPFQSSNGKVTVSRSQVVEVWSPSLSVVCRSEDFLCIFRLREYHRGSIIGLLGNADEYATNDFMLPDGNVSSNFLDFVRAYEVSGEPNCLTTEFVPPPTPTDEARMTCDEKLEDLCPAKSALREQFLEACASDIVSGFSPCHAPSALVALCHLQHRPTYTYCGANHQETPTIGRRLQVVLLVQQNKYLSSAEKPNSPVKGIESLVTALDQKFKGSGYESVQFAVVGFGGRGVHYPPTFHSVDKDLWLWLDTTVNSGLKSLEFKSREEADGVQALKYALEELGRDSFDSKVFVVITAKDKQVSEKTLMDYLQQQLEANGVTLYAISSYPSIEKGKKVYGVRADGLIFPAQAEGGDAYLDFPRGNLAKLASSTRGSVFLSKFLKENEPQAFFSEFAQEVWAKINKESLKCRVCQSVRGKWWWYRNECKIVPC